MNEILLAIVRNRLVREAMSLRGVDVVFPGEELENDNPGTMENLQRRARGRTLSIEDVRQLIREQFTTQVGGDREIRNPRTKRELQNRGGGSTARFQQRADHARRSAEETNDLTRTPRPNIGR